MPRKSKLPTHVPVGELSALSGQSARTIQAWTLKGLLPKPESREGGYPLMSSLEAIREVIQKKESGSAAEIADLKLSQQRAETETAIIEAMKASGEVVMADEVNGKWLDWLTQARVLIENASYIGRELRVRLTKEFTGIRTDGSADKS